MPVIDLNQVFPEGVDGTREPLPKQKLFLDTALDVESSKFIAYVGGVGSGKTVVGCVTVLTWAVMYPGDYLICRQFAPELKITTYKAFLEMCPPELIVENRIADAIVRIKAVGGKISNIMFRGLEEPDKHRSLNLNAFYIDEASQCSEAAFMLLQGRLRGKYVRKGILTSNPNGHDWIYKWFVKKDHIQSELAKNNFMLIKAPSTENKHLPDDYVQGMLSTWSEDRIRREVYGDFDSFAGQVYPEFRRDVHVIKPFVIPKEWTRIIGIDHGLRNPACWLWGAVDYDENIYIYREWYNKEWLIEEICKGRGTEKGVCYYLKGERIDGAYIDPTTTQRRGQTGFSDYDHYLENLPEGFPLRLGNHDLSPGIERVKQYLKVDERTNKPSMYIFDTCVNLIEEIAQYRYQELLPNQVGRANEKEVPVKSNDHSLDALRYLIMSRPEPPSSKDDIWKKIKYNSLEGALFRELQGVKGKGTVKDPFSDGL